MRELASAETHWTERVSTALSTFGPDLTCRTGCSVVSIGSGCSLAVARLAESVFSAAGAALAKTCTPYDFVASDARPDLACLVTAKGDHPDILECFARLKERDIPTIIVTLDADSTLARRARNYLSSTRVLSVPRPPIGGFVPVESTLAMACMLPATSSVAIPMPPGRYGLFAKAREDHEVDVGRLGCRLKQHMSVICTDWARAAGQDLETRITEAGLPSPSVSDPWNFGHGRYLQIAGKECFAVTMTVLGESQIMGHLRAHVPPSSLTCEIFAPIEGFWGGIYCLIRSMLLVGTICAERGIDPALPTVPCWGDELFLGGRSA